VLGLLSGDVDVFISDLSTTIGNIQGGLLKALAIAWPTRSPQLPDVPTFAELGYPGMVSSSWFGLAAPVDTPADIVARLHQAMEQTFANTAYQAALKKLGNEQFTLNPEQSAAFIKGEVEKWATVAKSANIQVD
jgi:tripartite-type tricarboxylate transporter receptor subunit TctC